MEEVLQANVFFYITSVAVIVLSIVMLAILVEVFLLVHSFRKTANRIRKASELFVRSASTLAASGIGLEHVLGLVMDKWAPKAKAAPVRKKRKGPISRKLAVMSETGPELNEDEGMITNR